MTATPNPIPGPDPAALLARYGALDGADLLAPMIHEVFAGAIAVTSSFGAESAVLLYLVSTIDPAVPVLFIDTGRHFPETLRYRDRLVDHLGLRDVRAIGPARSDVQALDPDGTLAYRDPDACCRFRKVQPLAAELAGFDATIGGRKRFHGAARTALPAIEFLAGRFAINPLVTWTADRIEAVVAENNLPRHPMVADGFLSIGCMPCTERAAAPGDIWSGRWAGRSKTECGIHKPAWF